MNAQPSGWWNMEHEDQYTLKSRHSNVRGGSACITTVLHHVHFPCVCCQLNDRDYRSAPIDGAK